MLICGIDFETTGTNPNEHRIIEAGAVLWDADAKKPVALLSDLVDTVDEVPSEITALTGITIEQLKSYSRRIEDVLVDLNWMLERADYGMAHFGAQFDEPFFRAECKRAAINPPERPWIDTSVDLPFPDSISTRNLLRLGAEHGFVNPFRHRAVFDVLSMLQVASAYPLDVVIARQKSPTLPVAAIVSFEEKEKAKARGFKWHAPSKTWWRLYKQCDLDAIGDQMGFRVAKMSQSPE